MEKMMDDLISRQAAIIQLSHNKNKGDDEWELAVGNDIQTIWKLPSAQSVPCEDAVSREVVKNAICDFICAPDVRCVSNHGCRMKQLISELPPIQPQRTGKWIPVGVVEVVGGESAMWGSAIAYHKCSECDKQALRNDFDEEVLSKWCPHCGAKMEGDTK